MNIPPAAILNVMRHHFDMKIRILMLGLIMLHSCKEDNQHQSNSIKIEVVNCMSSMVYSFEGDSVVIKQELQKYSGSKVELRKFSSSKVNTADFKRFTAIATKILEIKEDEVFDNTCIDDGFMIKVYIKFNGNEKNLLVGNYYDPRVDSVITVFDKYINRKDEILRDNAFKYSESADGIKELIADQIACPIRISDEMKKHLLHGFCK